MLTYDQMSAVRMAFDEAHLPADRRRAQRVRTWCNAEICPWNRGRAEAKFGVVVTDFSTTGIGILHTGRLTLGTKYLLEIARPEQTPLAVVFTVARCSETDGGMFDVELAPEEIVAIVSRCDPQHASAVVAPKRPMRVALILIAFLGAALAIFVKLVEIR